MKRLVILVGILVGLGFQPGQVESADASSAWNSVAASYNFNMTYSAMMGSTFAQNYHGTDFNADFAAILDHVADIMGASPPAIGGGDVMAESLANWPE